MDLVEVSWNKKLKLVIPEILASLENKLWVSRVFMFDSECQAEFLSHVYM